MATIQKPEESTNPGPEDNGSEDAVLTSAQAKLEEVRNPKGGFFGSMMGRWFIPVFLYFIGLIVLAATADQNITHYVSIGVGSILILLIFLTWYQTGTTTSDVKALKAEQLAREDLELEQREIDRRFELLRGRE